MIRVITVKLYPNAAQQSAFVRYLDAGRRVYNHFLEHRIKIWKRRRESTSFEKQSAMLTRWRQQCETARSVPADIQRDALRRLDRAMKAFFRRCNAGDKPGFPRFKGRNRWQSFESLRAANYVDCGKIRVPGIGLVRCRNLRPFTGEAKSLRILKKANGWHSQLLIDDGCSPPNKRPIQSAIGLDVGLSAFVTGSDGTSIVAPQYFRRLSRKLASHQRRVARKRKGSANRHKAIQKLCRVHQRIADSRSSFTHKLSKEYVDRYDLIAVEQLNIAGLSRGLLSKSILDAAWAQFIQRLSYKAESAGVTFVAVDARGTSQECCRCGETAPKDLSERIHRCACGCELNRDHNAAINVLNRGLLSLSTAGSAGIKACGERPRSTKQEVLN